MPSNFTQEDVQTLEALSIAYGAPSLHHVILKELLFLEKTKPDSGPIGLMRQSLQNYILGSKVGLRDFPSEYGPLGIMITTRDDTGLVSEDINTVPGTMYKKDDPTLIRHEELTNGPLTELFGYISYYVYQMMQKIEPELYNALLEVFEASRIIPLPFERILQMDGHETKKLVLSIAFEKKDQEPVVTKYCLSVYPK